MNRQDESRKQAQSIEDLISRLESVSDPEVKAAAQELVQALMEFHGAGLERWLDIIRESGDPGRAIIDRLGRDELVRSLLLLYGLHPVDLRTRVEQALDGMRRSLESNGASAALVSIDEAGAVSVHFQAKSTGCGSAGSSLRSSLEAALHEAAPDASAIHIRDTSSSPSGIAFVPLANLLPGDTAPVCASSGQPGNGD
jgi:Fe-S cluster biogenesis protein NfuA